MKEDLRKSNKLFGAGDAFIATALFAMAIFLLMISAGNCDQLTPLVTLLEKAIPGIYRYAQASTGTCGVGAMHSVFWILILPAATITAPVYSTRTSKEVTYGGIIFVMIIETVFLFILFNGTDQGHGKFSRMMRGSEFESYIANLILLLLPPIFLYVIASAIKSRSKINN